MNKSLILLACAFLLLGIGGVAVADQDLYGIIKSRPAGKVGTWVVGGHSVEVTERTRLKEHKGPLQIGACAEVEIDEGKVKEIESEPLKKCGK
jgi:hypothetical protein